MSLPQGFIDEMRLLLGEETDNFLIAMQRPPVVSVRLNPRKPGASFPEGTPVKWCEEGQYLPTRPDFTLDPLLHAGAYYVQDASSMIYFEVTRRLLSLMGNPDKISVLDLCAAPGGKTTAMIDALPDGSKVTANEYVAKRVHILRENLSRWGYPDVAAVNRDTSAFPREGNVYDIVAVDAPCSGEGMMRKDAQAREQWSEDLVEKCAALQREILANASATVRPGGFLIYSTCTFNRKENEENVRYVAEELGLEPVDLNFPEDWGIARGIKTPYPVYRFMPHVTEGEGLFLAVFRNPGEEESNRPETVRKASVRFHKARPKEKDKDTVPEIDEILSVDFDRSRFPIIELSREEALQYLRRESLVLPEGTPRGIVMMAYKGLLLGPAKNIGSRANNLYPKNRRILKRE
ncbi:MAG: hypothetical protein K2G90_04385 [Muribaculaceae bacterium]|nr:hypothetical protein [Muribaculaceae bacterium]